jgi:hypothetical protein
LDLAKYLGEGTSRREAEEKSSAFFIVGRFLVHVLDHYSFRPTNPLTQNVISDAEEMTEVANLGMGLRFASHSQGLTVRLLGLSPA